jgi:hypothetical protein
MEYKTYSFNSFIDKNFYWYLHLYCIGKYFTDRLMDINSQSEKLLSVIFGL